MPGWVTDRRVAFVFSSQKLVAFEDFDAMRREWLQASDSFHRSAGAARPSLASFLCRRPSSSSACRGVRSTGAVQCEGDPFEVPVDLRA